MTDALITVSIVLGAQILWRMWPKIFKRRPKRSKIKPKAPWNGKHELAEIFPTEDFIGGEYESGWVWRCSCGIGNMHRMTHFLPFLEENALHEFTGHRGLYQNMEQSIGS